jgi:hypothetical protein
MSTCYRAIPVTRRISVGTGGMFFGVTNLELRLQQYVDNTKPGDSLEIINPESKTQPVIVRFRHLSTSQLSKIVSDFRMTFSSCSLSSQGELYTLRIWPTIRS